MSLPVKDCNKDLTIILPDIHFPEHSPQALAVAKAVIDKLKPRTVVQLGDMIDAGAFSAHAALSFDEKLDTYYNSEIKPAQDLISFCLERSNKFVYLQGNHESRVERWCLKAGFSGRAAFDTLDPKHLLTQGIPDKEIEVIPYVNVTSPISTYNVCHDLYAVHGWSFAVNAAKVHLDKAKSASIVFGHCHRAMSTLTRDPFSGKILKAWSPGCLSKLQPLYFTGGSPSDWVHGMSLVYSGTKSWTEYSLVIDRGRVILPDGDVITG